MHSKKNITKASSSLLFHVAGIGLACGIFQGLYAIIGEITAQKYFHFGMYRLAWDIFLSHLDRSLIRTIMETTGAADTGLAVIVLLALAAGSVLSQASAGDAERFFRFLQGMLRFLFRLAMALTFLAGLFLMTAAGLMAIGGNAPPASAPNVLLITIDTLRADRLGVYGNTRLTSPNIDAFAKESLVFENATSQSPWTLPSMATLFTGLYPSEHKAVEMNFKMEDKYNTLAEYFKNAGYTTIGITSHFFVNSKFGFDQGFMIFDESNIKGDSHVSSPDITETAINLLEKHGEKPFFLWVHYFDPHFDYLDHESHRFYKNYDGVIRPGASIDTLRSPERKNYTQEDIQFLFDLYDGEIAFTDEYIGKLLSRVREKGLMKNTLIVLTSDHGEEFMERGWIGHTNSLYEEQVHVPLILYDPARRAGKGRVSKRVEIRALFSTILKISGISPVDDSFYKSPDLRSLRENSAEQPVFTETQRYEDLRGVLLGNYKFIYDKKRNHMALYDLEKDPNESRDLFDEYHARNDPALKQMRDYLRSYFVETDSGHSFLTKEKVDLSPEELAHFRSLGYV